MKREIKFRAWDKRHNQFCTDFGMMQCPDGSFYIDYVRGNKFEHHVDNNENVEIMQFTGLKDKNGNEIYADDILFDGEHKFRVYAMYGGFGIKAPHWSGIMEDMVMGDDLIMQPLADAQTMSYISQSMEVIGNIYENPELLKQQ